MKALSLDSEEKTKIEDKEGLKYALLTNGSSYYESFLKTSLERGGLYSWQRAFPNSDVILAAQIKRNVAMLNDYDIVHVNMCPSEVGIIKEVKPQLDGNTKLIANLDYAIESLYSSFKHVGAEKTVDAMIHDFSHADMVFGVEPFQVEFLKLALEDYGTPVHLIPHPTPVEELQKPPPHGLFIPYEERQDIIAFMYHRYDGHLTIPKILLHKLPVSILRYMFGFTDDNLTIHDLRYFDGVSAMSEWKRFIIQLAHCLWGVEYRSHHAASRFAAESAALGIPVVCTDNCYLGKLMWPELAFHPMEMFAMRDKILQITSDEKYRMKMAEQGHERIKSFGLKESAQRLREVIKL
jgi:hypothetical protein